MSISNYYRKSGAHKKTDSISNRTLTRSDVQKQVPFLKEKYVAAGTYNATIISVFESVTQGGDEALDVVYKLRDSNGRTFDAKERLIWDSRPYNALIDHLIDTGLLGNGADLGDMVGICEEVTVVYPYKGAFGRFQNRQPCRKKSALSFKTKKHDLLDNDADEDEPEEDTDDEFDDFLEEESDEI